MCTGATLFAQAMSFEDGGWKDSLKLGFGTTTLVLICYALIKYGQHLIGMEAIIK